ncbi:MAG TPA: nuclear transport factor 2 family protein [Longimicrobiaceae bacterium]|nr:nuclear transport factor 2 family protein [Longimicrobiaceae bacterium]
MTRRSRIALLTALPLVLGAGSLLSQPLPTPRNTDWNRERQEYTADMLKDYNQLINEWREAWDSHNPRQVADFYSEGGFLVFTGGEMSQGKPAIQRWLSGLLPNVVDIRLAVMDFVASGRMAYAMGPYWYQYKPEGSAEVMSQTGTYVAVVVQEGGRWRIRSQVFTPETLPAGGAPAPGQAPPVNGEN